MSRVMFAFGGPKAFASRWMKPVESPIAVVEGEDTVKATDAGPYRSATRRIAEAVRFRASFQLIGSQGVGRLDWTPRPAFTSRTAGVLVGGGVEQGVNCRWGD